MATKLTVPFPEDQIALGPFCVDVAATRLLRDGTDLELRPRAFRALQVLVQNPGRTVDYEDMIDQAWDGVQVSKHTINVTVGEIKNALKEYGSWITCRAKFGYCLEIPESEDLIRTGWHFRNQFTRAGFENALRCFEQAAQQDSADFRAIEAICGTHLMVGAFLLRDPRAAYRDFLEAHQRAVAMRGLKPELRLDRAYGYYVFEGDLDKAESELLAVQRERPRLPEVYARLAMVYLARGRFDEALASMQQARATDNLVPPLAFVETLVRNFRRELDAAVACGKETVDLHPGSPFGRLHYAEALEHSGRHEEALAEYRFAAAMSPCAPWVRAKGARFMAKMGRSAEALEILNELERRRGAEHVDAYHLALLLHALGRPDEAFQELERAYEEKSYLTLLLHVDPKADQLREDSRFARFRDKVIVSAQSALESSPN